MVRQLRKGILLAGGSGTRLHPITITTSKQLLPIYDKPMIYYSLSVLMVAGIQELALITTQESRTQYESLLGTGERWGVSIKYIVQPSPDGLAQAYILAEDFIDESPTLMVLGDNIFYGHGLSDLLSETPADKGATIFGYHVADPERYGVVELDPSGKALRIEEKPLQPLSNYAVTGLYLLDGSAPSRARQVKPSSRGELEITSILNSYLDDGLLSVSVMGRGFSWLDTGTHSSLLDASNFVRTLQERQGLQVGCLEEIAFRNGWISLKELDQAALGYPNNSYGHYLKRLADNYRN
ncbi:MAG: glucose-1-phosphate thymidylyltransferase [Legionellales bacterium]|nr:glucose-1-phosphate thymidylyltransferase [Legionellales bacterium]